MSAVAQAATITVNSVADAGGTCPGATCTLRQAILSAASGDTINFDPRVTAIDLTSAELLINKNLTINGASAGGVIVERNAATGTPAFRILNIPPGNVSVTLFALVIGRGSGDSSGGGAILHQGSGTLTVSNSTIAANTADGDGGGIANSNNGTVTIINCTISGNSSQRISSGFVGGNGGGISNSSGGLVTVTNTSISANQATGVTGGGGILNLGTMTITASTISSNKGSVGSGGTVGAGSGAGIYNGGTVTITNSTISGNVGARFGGGILNAGSAATVNIVNSTISGNRAASQGSGGGVHVFSDTVNARNSLFAGNLPGDFVGTLTSQGYNLIHNTNGTTIVGVTTGNQLNVDPMLGPLQDNGGPTLTQALLNGSPARDKGDSSGSSTDQRGFTRPIDNPFIPNAAGGDGSDIGAFEIQAGLTARSLNISTRSRVQSGDNVMIAGFIITGNVPKQVILRGLGPSLVNGGVPAAEVLGDPVLELHGASGTLIISNDNWKDSPQRAQIEGTAFQPTDDREAVILTTLPPASYTAVVKGVAGSTGLGLVEVYDLDQSSDSMLTNISSRALVETGDNIVIAGFTLGGSTNGSPLIVIRGLGPSLAAFGITNSLADPILQLRDSNGTQLASNDNWKNDPGQQTQIVAAGLQPQDDLEAAIAAALPPGAYTAILFGVNGGTGVGTVEVYNLQ
ncbi:MAG TPA: right-handed parallel beta-helix repeat-containing protein [Bradyrhizobium sp.]|nr:right-handed parallel beta-helix repeat-containing protein [Bradyrhizobium sp.]